MAFELNYSAMDRLLHRLAFGVPDAQLIAASVEGTAFGSSYAQVEARRPIFLTSLPRAGTTVLLEALHRLPTVATHTYRDMPFVLAPVLWARFSGGFQRKAELSERAHGDGLEVGYDSPEAFEEVFWRAFWSGHYGPERITLWRAADAKADATEFLRGLMKKVVALRRPDHPQDGRYLSKNNANVARLELLPGRSPTPAC